MDDRGTIPGRSNNGNFSHHYCIQTGCGAHLASYPLSTEGFYPGGAEAGAWSWPLSFI